MSRDQSANADLDVDLRTLFGSIGRRWKRVLGVSVAVGALAFVLASAVTPQYRSEARILIETRESSFTRPAAGPDGDRSILDEEGVTSQVEVINSTGILTNVARQFNLASRPEFDSALNPSLGARLLSMVGMGPNASELPPEERVLTAFREKLQVFRVERSRVIVVQFSSEDPQLAAQVPNAVADAFITVQRDAKLESNTDATAWLEPEIATLTDRVRDAEARVAQYRGQSDLLVGNNNSVLATQELSEVTSELSRVRAARGSAEAAAASVRASLDAVPEVLRSALIQRLRERQVQLRADIADLSTTLLDNHPRIRSLRSQLADLDGQVANEARNVLRSLSTEAETARLREQELVSQLNSLKVASARAGEQEVELRALEREAASQRELLESYLTRYREASSRGDGNYLPADARVISRAIQPAEPYFPKVIPITIAAFLASLLLMAVATLLSELFSGRAMRPAGPVGGRDDTLDAAPEEPVVVASSRPATLLLPASVLHLKDETAAPVAAAEPPVETAATPEPVDPDKLGIVRAAETLVLEDRARCLFVSPEGDEASAVSVMVAREVSDTGLKVLLVDLTANGAASSPMLDDMRLSGITNLLASEAQIADVIHHDQFSDAHVIPSGTADAERAMRAIHRLPIILDALGSAYDIVIVECGAADGESVSRLAKEDTAVLVSAIGTEEESVASLLSELEAQGCHPKRVSPGSYEPPTRPEEGRDAA